MLMKELALIQSKLKAPKGQYNSFGKYKYRSCEDILESVKPLLQESECTLTITDDVVAIGNRIYIKATATLKNGSGETETTTAFAREEETKKGMDGSQVTGAASSYARKYALNGLFCIDDNKDSDSTNTHGKDESPKDNDPLKAALARLEQCKTKPEAVALWNEMSSTQSGICAQGSEFYKAVAVKLQSLPEK